MADDTERLFVALEARVTQFEREWKRAGQTGSRTFQQLRQNSSRATRQMEQDAERSASRINQSFATIGTKVGNYGKAFAAGIWSGVAAGGIAGVAAAVRAVAASFAELSNEAKTAGINVEDFQRWGYVAEQNRISVDALVDGFKELNLRADEYIQTGKGSAAESFQRLGMSPEEVKQRIKDPSAFMLELIDRTRRLKDTAAGVRIFDELLGGSGGEQFVRLIEQGREGITATLTEADKMGAVMDENFIRRAEEVDKKFNQIARTIGSTLKSVIVDAVTALQGFISQWNELSEKSMSGMRAELEILKQSRDRLNETQPTGGFEDKIAGVFGQDRESQLARIATREKEITDEMERRKAIIITTPDKPPVAPYVPPKDPDKKRGKSKGTKERADEYQRLTQRIRENMAALQAETEAQGMLNPAINDYGYAVEKARMQQELLNAAKRAGKEITPQLKKEIEGLAHEYANTRAEAEKMAEAQNKALDDLDFRKDIVRDALGGLRSALEDGKISFEELGDIALSVLDKIIDKIQTDLIDAIFSMNKAASGGGGGSWLSGLFGGIFGGGGSDPWAGLRVPGYANGTNFAPGGAAWVGERGPELVNLPRGSQVIPNHSVGNYLSGGASGGQGLAEVGRTVIEVRLADGVVGSILQEANNNSVKLLNTYDKDQQNARQNGRQF